MCFCTSCRRLNSSSSLFPHQKVCARLCVYFTNAHRATGVSQATYSGVTGGPSRLSCLNLEHNRLEKDSGLACSGIPNPTTCARVLMPLQSSRNFSKDPWVAPQPAYTKTCSIWVPLLSLNLGDQCGPEVSVIAPGEGKARTGSQRRLQPIESIPSWTN